MLAQKKAQDTNIYYRGASVVNRNIVRRTLARCAAVQTMYTIRFLCIRLHEAMNIFIDYWIPNYDFYKDMDVNFYKKLMLGYDDKMLRIVNNYCDNKIKTPFDSLASDIITIAAIEMYNIKTKPTIVINEYIEIAKDFCSDKAVKFINFVLDRLYKDMCKIETNQLVMQKSV